MAYKDPAVAREKARLRSLKWRQNNPEKSRERNLAFYYRNHEKSKAYAREWHHKNREQGLLRSRKQQLAYYGLTLEQYAALGSACEICGTQDGQFLTNDKRRKRVLSVDHDKATKKVRGLLCGHCNFGIGQLKHDCDLLRKAIDYLTRFNESLKSG